MQLIILLMIIVDVNPINVLPLKNFNWKVQNLDKKIEESVTIPSGIYSDLRKVGILNESIFYRFNDVNYRWIGSESWVYYVNFSADKDILVAPNHELIFHGLDGTATIFFNQIEVGKAVNTFVRYRFDVTSLLQNINILRIKFDSPIKTAFTLSKQSSHSIPPNCVPPDYHGECHVNFLRRMPASFSWDWGPAFPSVGVWKDVEFVGYRNDVIIRNIIVSTTPQNKVWNVTIKVYCDAPLNALGDINGKISIVIFLENNYVTSSKDVFLSVNSQKREVIITDTIIVPNESVKLWWPNGYGSQNLYNLSVTYKSANGNHTKNIQFGFRTVKLVQEPVNSTNPEQGLSFYFSINDVPIFAKGSNYIPSHILPEETSNESAIQHLLYSAKVANMNMIRVWGGGVYESDYFYELCDQYGIMIWQDMMFACSLYPTDDQFLSTVSEEISQQVKRLQYHASIVLWAGNNENEAALSGNWYDTKKNFTLYKEEYNQLYVNTIKPIILNIDNTRSYLVSSPTNGIKSDMEDHISSNPYSPLYGDVHHYNYIHNSWLIDNYPMTRFSSEYGYQSFPSLSTLRKVANDDDLASLSTPFMQHRQHLAFGYFYLIFSMYFHFPVPKLNDLDNLIYISQINQAWSVKSQTEWYRKWRSTLLPNGNGRTMGALYWQLNDVWEAPSWSSIEFGGKWKMLQYYARKFFSPTMITADLNRNGTITINIISDLLEDTEVNVKLAVFKWDSMEPVHMWTNTMIMKKESSEVYMTTKVENLIDSKPECKSLKSGEKCFLKLILIDKNNETINDNYLFPTSFKSILGLQNPKITASAILCNSDQCIIKVRTNAIALFVWLDVDNMAGYFSDNGFVMTELEKEVIFYSKNTITANAIQNSLHIKVLGADRLITI